MNKRLLNRLEAKASPKKWTELPIFLEIDSREPEYTQIPDSILKALGVDPELYELIPGTTGTRKASLEDKALFSSHDQERVYWASRKCSSIKLEFTL